MKKIIACVFVYTLSVLYANAQVPKSCVSHSGFTVPYIANFNLNNVGMATFDNFNRPIIIMNPNVLKQFPPLAREFWFAHECAHHALKPWQNSEDAADCYAIKAMDRLQLLEDPYEVNEFYRSLANLPGNVWTGHRPGRERIRNMQFCLVN